MKDKRPIGIFDSGIGGLTVLKEIIHKLPYEDFVYLGDTARVPYGNKSQQTVIRYAMENVAFLLKYDIKALVIACNTASAYANQLLKKKLQIPVVGVIEPACITATKVTKSNKIAVLGTKATILSKAYDKEIEKRIPGAHLFTKSCPLFVPFVEENMISHAALELVIKEYIDPVKKFNPDTILLGCTHYPLLKDKIQTQIDPHIHLVDSCVSCANHLSQIISSNKLRTDQKIAGSLTFFVSDDPISFSAFGEVILGRKMKSVNQIFIQEINTSNN